jgi:two-component system cell cycle sensor histidine kinase PleC
MFANIRIFSIAMALFVLIVSFIGNYYAKEYIVKHFISEPLNELSQELYEAYSKNIWNRYYPVVSYIKSLPEPEWSSLYQYQSFIIVSREYLAARPLLKVRVLSLDDQVLFDSDESLMIVENTSEVKKAIESVDLKGNNDRIIKIKSREIKSAKGVESKVLYSVTIPIFVNREVSAKNQAAADNAKGMIEFFYDIDHHYKMLTLAEYLITVLLALVITPIVWLLVFSSKKVEELIEKQQEASLELANAKAIAESESKAKSQFLANVSHELRTPLNAIIGFSEIINSEAMGPVANEKYKEFVHDIHASGVHLLSLINDILDFSKAEENKLQIDFEQVDLTKTVKICLRMMLPRAEEAKVQLVDEVPTEHVIIMADTKRTKQIVLNLLSNAVKFTPEGGQVITKIWKNMDNNSVVLQIKDSGVGMVAQDLARALSPFGQVENKLSKRFEGTGLGLPLTKRLIELMHGNFDIQSEPSLGTTVTITFAFQSNEVEVQSMSSA